MIFDGKIKSKWGTHTPFPFPYTLRSVFACCARCTCGHVLLLVCVKCFLCVMCKAALSLVLAPNVAVYWLSRIGTVRVRDETAFVSTGTYLDVHKGSTAKIFAARDVQRGCICKRRSSCCSKIVSRGYRGTATHHKQTLELGCSTGTAFCPSNNADSHWRLLRLQSTFGCSAASPTKKGTACPPPAFRLVQASTRGKFNPKPCAQIPVVQTPHYCCQTPHAPSS